mgnify:FL=1
MLFPFAMFSKSSHAMSHFLIMKRHSLGGYHLQPARRGWLLLLLLLSSLIGTSDPSNHPALLLAAAGRIKHIVVLMEENRSFDNMLGYYPGTKHGLRGNESNPVNAFNATAGTVRVSPTAKFINECDPNHSLNATTYKIFGPVADTHQNFSDPTMSGFVQWEGIVDGHNATDLHYCGVMEGFAPTSLPVMTTLASEFVLFDHFFASLPGPTWPNRLFFMAGTSAGLTETYPWYRDDVGRLFPMPTIFDQVAEAGGTFKIYYNDTPWELFVEAIAHHPEHTVPMDEFFADARRGTLPDFAYINPRSGINLTIMQGSNDQHPDHDVRAGEQYYKDIYEALRASPQWNETLFIVTYDEHGGFFDHVAPRNGIPSPGDGETSYPDPNFTFTRGGIRIPTLMASPWLPRGLVVTDPPQAQRPRNDSYYELTSIMATTRKLLEFMWGTPALTNRDAWAATFEHLFDLLDEPRTDCPLHLPQVASSERHSLLREAQQPLNPLQWDIVRTHAGLLGLPVRGGAVGTKEEGAATTDAEEEAAIMKGQLTASFGGRTSAGNFYVERGQRPGVLSTTTAELTRQGHVSHWLQAHHTIHRRKTLAWKRSKALSMHPPGGSCGNSSNTTTLRVRLIPFYYCFADHVEKNNVTEIGSNWTVSVGIHGSGGGQQQQPADRKALVPWQTIWVEINSSGTKIGRYCWHTSHRVSRQATKAANVVEGDVIGASLCYPSSDPARNRDVTQHFVLEKDATIRPYANQSLCVTNHVWLGEAVLALLPCVGGVNQHYAYHDALPGMGDWHHLYFGDGTNAIATLKPGSAVPHERR